ncbi:MAG: AAA family ATPase [Candidatus Methanospirareceae archaeon]
MIKKLKIKNYKSLKDVELELEKFNVLIGPNASGKSNLLDCLAFVSEIAQRTVDGSLAGRGGYERVVFGGKKENIELAIDFMLDNEALQYLISISEKGIDEERLFIGDVGVIDRHLNNVRLDTGKTVGARSTWTTAIYDHSPKTKEYLNSWRSYNFITSEMRETYRAERNLILDKNGGNLAQVLLSLHNERSKTFDKIEDMLKQAIPQIDELLTPLTESGETYVAVREKGFDYHFDYFQVSDGTLKLLAYITAITANEPKLVCFEEPENFIHPRLFELLVEILKKSDKQIILSTHSPYLVDWVEPEDVIIVEKKDQETVMGRIKEGDKLKKRLVEMGLALGEYWYGGGLGGNP